MFFTPVPKELLDRMWETNKLRLTENPNDWNALELEVLLENEYKRQNWLAPVKG